MIEAEGGWGAGRSVSRKSKRLETPCGLHVRRNFSAKLPADSKRREVVRKQRERVGEGGRGTGIPMFPGACQSAFHTTPVKSRGRGWKRLNTSVQIDNRRVMCFEQEIAAEERSSRA